MSYAFEVREVAAQPVLYVPATCAQTEIGPTLMQILPEVFGYVQRAGAAPAGPPFARYTGWRESDCDLEGGIPVAQPAAGEGRIQAGEIGGCQALFAVHVGPYDRLREAWAAAEAWLAANGRSPAGAPWESYVTDPGEVPNPEEWRTEIYWPIG